MTTMQIYACLREFKNGRRESIDFDVNNFLDINEEIVAILERLREDKPLEFHARMHKLYNLVTCVSTSLTVFHGN